MVVVGWGQKSFLFFVEIRKYLIILFKNSKVLFFGLQPITF